MKSPIQVLSVGHSYVVSMNRAILRELAKDRGFSVTVGAPEFFKGSLRTIALEPEPPGSLLKVVPLRAHFTKRMHIFAYDHFDLKKLFKENFDCAHFWEEPYIFAGYQLGQMAKRNRVPFLFRTAQSLVKKYPQPFRFFEQRTLQASSQWVAGGHLVYQTMLEKGWKKKGRVITLAVDTDAFQPFDDLTKKKGRDELGLQAPVFGYLGRLSEEKGLDLMMQFLAPLKEKNWSLLCMGSGEYKEKLEKWAKSLGIESRVKVVLLKHDEVPNVLPVCDLLLCPSQTRPFWKEQFGRMIVEAFASGVPVVGSDSGEIPRVIGDSGVVLPEADAEAWQETIADFLKHPESFAGFKRMGLERVHLFSAKTIAEQYKSVYSELANIPYEVKT